MGRYSRFRRALTISNNWNFAASYTSRNIDVAAGVDVDDKLYQFSVGYVFENGIGIDVGYSFREEANVDTETAGALLAYTYEF